MKKKIVALLLATSLVVSTAACGSDKAGEDKKTEQQSTAKTDNTAGSDTSSEDNDKDGGSLSAEKKLLSVEVTIPAALLGEDADMSELTEEAKENGVKEVTQNADGSITMKMTKEAHKKLLDSIKQSLDESIAETLADKENCPSFDSISYNEDVTVFDVKVNAATFGGLEGIYALAYYIMGNMYQAFNAVPESELKTVVNFIDKDTGEVIESGDSTEMANTDFSGSDDAEDITE